jgi:hypothetical protein
MAKIDSLTINKNYGGSGIVNRYDKDESMPERGILVRLLWDNY